MADIKILQAKVDNLKTLIERDSITPVSLGTLLDYFIEVIAGIRSTLESSDSNIISQITDLSTELTAKATRLEEGYKSADEGLSARITTNANNIAANASAIATHGEEISGLTAECRALDEAFHSADEGLQKGIDANKASIAKNAAEISDLSTELTAATRSLEEGYLSADEGLQKGIDANKASIAENATNIASNADEIKAVRLIANKNRNDIAKIHIVDFHGFESMANLQDQQSVQDREEASGKILYLRDVGYFACLEDPTLPIGWHDDEDWDGELYNMTTDSIKHPRPDMIFRLNNNLYHGGVDAGVPYLVKIADNDEVDHAYKLSTEHSDTALREALASLVPTGLTVGELPRLTMGNLEPIFLTAALEPEGVAQNINYITDNQVVSVAPDGKITLIAPGHAEIHVIPTLNTALAKSVAVEVVEPTVMGVSIASTGSEEEEGTTAEMRLLSDDTIRFN